MFCWFFPSHSAVKGSEGCVLVFEGSFQVGSKGNHKEHAFASPCEENTYPEGKPSTNPAEREVSLPWKRGKPIRNPQNMSCLIRKSLSSIKTSMVLDCAVSFQSKLWDLQSTSWRRLSGCFSKRASKQNCFRHSADRSV